MAKAKEIKLQDSAEEIPTFYFDPEFTGEACRVLLLEVLKRAIYDWVLYRNSKKIQQRAIADEAKMWLFEEQDQGLLHRQREVEGRAQTSFRAICIALELDPEAVRERARSITEKQVLNLGRPRIHRKRRDMKDAEVTGDVLHMDELRSAARAQPRDMLEQSMFSLGR